MSKEEEIMANFDLHNEEVRHMLMTDALVAQSVRSGMELTDIILLLSKRHQEDQKAYIDLYSKSTRPMFH